MCPECKIHAFEPMPENYACLDRNIDNFHLTNANTYQCAISDEYSQGFMTRTSNRSLDNQLIKMQAEDNLDASTWKNY